MLQAIGRLERVIHGGETARVARSFHLGLVGGSGKAVKRLNKRREREMDRILDAVGRREKLGMNLGGVKARISRIDDGSAYQEAVARQQRRQKKASRVTNHRDTAKRIRDAMSAGDNSYRFQNGAIMSCYCGWDKAIRKPIGIVVLTAPDGLFYLHRAKSIQGVNFGEAGVELSGKYLTARQDLVPAGVVL